MVLQKKYLFVFVLMFAVISQSDLFAQNSSANSIYKPGESHYFDGSFTLIKGTSVSLQIPLRFDAQPDGETFLHKGSNSTIQIKEVKNSSYKKVLSNVTERTFSQQGFHLDSTETITLQSGITATLYHVSFKAGDVDFKRFMLLAGNDNKLVWIHASFPKIMEFLFVDVLRKSLLSVKF